MKAKPVFLFSVLSLPILLFIGCSATLSNSKYISQIDKQPPTTVVPIHKSIDEECVGDICWLSNTEILFVPEVDEKLFNPSEVDKDIGEQLLDAIVLPKRSVKVAMSLVNVETRSVSDVTNDKESDLFNTYKSHHGFIRPNKPFWKNLLNIFSDPANSFGKQIPYSKDGSYYVLFRRHVKSNRANPWDKQTEYATISVFKQEGDKEPFFKVDLEEYYAGNYYKVREMTEYPRNSFVPLRVNRDLKAVGQAGLPGLIAVGLGKAWRVEGQVFPRVDFSPDGKYMLVGNHLYDITIPKAKKALLAESFSSIPHLSYAISPDWTKIAFLTTDDHARTMKVVVTPMTF